MMPMMFDPTMILIIPALVFAFWAQSRVKSTFVTYSEIRARGGVTADSVSRTLLDRFGLQGVRVERVPGNLTDHYDPRDKVLRLSDSVGGSTSIAAIGVAAHEVGHAIQDKEGYVPLRLRNAIVPVVNIGSMGAFPLFLIGLFMGAPVLINLGIILFAGVVVFHLVTLPVELDASARALKLLSSTGILMNDELGGARKVLNAAALTYVAATIMAIAQLLRLLILSRGRR
ncbi:MAG: zinc metallopeptidase [Synergistaceae bacterium]|nr:zinc metallopeptidase [Synergistaceae bacterium]